MTRTFVLTNHKGGVGKSTSATTIALGIAGVLRRAGASNSRVLLIDTDSQGHATLVTTGRNDFGAEDSLYAVLAADRHNAAQVLSQCIVQSTCPICMCYPTPPPTACTPGVHGVNMGILYGFSCLCP